MGKIVFVYLHNASVFKNFLPQTDNSIARSNQSKPMPKRRAIMTTKKDSLFRKDQYGRTELFFCQNAQTAAYLIEHGLNVNARDNVGRTALFEFKNNLEMAKTLIEHGADANAIDSNHKNALFRCNNFEIAKLLIEHGADASLISNNGLTALFGCQNVDTARLLLEKGAKANAIDKTNGQNALFDCYNAEVVELLIKHGADASCVNKNGRTALFECPFHYIGHQNLEQTAKIIHILVENGADINHTDHSRTTALDYCTDKEVAEILVAHGAKITPNSPWVIKDGQLVRSGKSGHILHL